MKKYVLISAVALLSGTAVFAGTSPAGKGKNKNKFEKADTNKDGRISQTEAKANKKWFAKFGLIDANKDGFLTLQEINSYKKK